MKINTVVLVIICFMASCLAGCSSKYGRYHPDDKHALQSIAGGVLGALIAGNTGGAIVGALVIDAYSVPTVKYEDKKIEEGDEAARRLKQPYEKAEDKREVDKKAEDKREVDKKAEDKREVDKKAEDKREVDKKAEDKRGVDKKAEDKRGVDKKAEDKREQEQKAGKSTERQQKAAKNNDEKQVKLFIGESLLEDHIVRAGSPVEAKIQYSVLANKDVQGITITETRILISGNKSFELDSREVYRTQGTYLTTVKFKIPDEVPYGYCLLYTTISNGTYRKTTKALLQII